MVKVLDRESINRMVSRTGSGGVGGGGGGSDIDLTGYATKSWTDENYVGKEFFSSLFKALDANGNEVLPNDTATTIDSIKAMFGFWTDFYISALGTGGQSTVGLRLAQLADVNVAGVTNGQVLTYDSTTGKWIASTPQAGTDMATVWANLAANGNQQINASHLTTALTGYATQTWVNTQINDMATKTWANGQFLKLTGGTLTGDLTVESVEIGHTNEINALQSSNLYLQYRNSGNLILCYNGANVGIGAMTTPSYKLHVLGDIYANEGWLRSSGSTGWYNESYGGGWYMEDDTWIRSYNGKYVYISSNLASEHIYAGGGSYNANYPLYINGVGYASSGFYTAGYVTALSDARHKDVIVDTGLTVEQIAKMPAVVYRWNDGRKDDSLHVGSIAQDWQRVLPEVVMQANDEEGTLSMQYGVAALVSSIITARKVVDHERRIAELERENKELKMKLNIA